MKQPVQYSGGILVRSGQYLFGKRSVNHSPFPSTWDIVGGHMEAGESADAALKREFKEELGVEPLVFQLYKVVEPPIESDAGFIRFFIYFITAWTAGEPVNRSNEHSEIKWFFRQELDDLALASIEYLHIIDDWRNPAKKRLPLP